MPVASEDQTPDRFVRDLARMLLVFVSVLAVDLIVLSLFTGKIRLWFPVWVDPLCNSRPDSPVIYSQSYIAGICFIPLLFYFIDRDWLANRASSLLRTGYWVLTCSVLGFVAWWKGGLMIEHHKETEAIAWVALTTLGWVLVVTAQALPRWLKEMTRQRLLLGLVKSISVFFLVMGILDPVVVRGIHQMPWSTGLIIEMAFFLPAGTALWFLARHLSKKTV